MVWLLIVALLADSMDAPAASSFRVPLAAAESLAVETAGAGEPVVLIPGLFGSQFGFRKIVPLLNAAGYRTIVIEPLGIGSSSRPEHADYSLFAQAGRIAGVLDSLRIDHALVIGHSMGAAEAFRLAYRRPDLVWGLVAVEGGPTEAAVTPMFRRALKFAPWIKLFGGIRLIRLRTRSMLITSSGDSTWVTDEVVTGYTAGAARNLDATLKAYIAMANSREPERLAPHLVQVHCPVRLLVGGAPHDGGVNPPEVELLQRVVGAFSVDSVPGAGHFLHEERPEAVVEALARVQASLRALHQRTRPPSLPS
ncbi:MAG TPA: alpha/beta hydrolase [Gemmatimonadales bacterium]|jgi:pimeloyl-ACP methyl ester carboxylesterase|nr:alpha/beta hydrolase [Gemmatimonadales bacterium]